MKQATIILLLSLLSTAAFSAPPNGTGSYYASADGKKGAALKTALSGIVQTTVERDYDDLWTDFRRTDRRADGKVWDIYSSITNYVFGSSAEGHNYQGEGDSYNREHSFPKSWFGGKVKPMYTDLFHMYPTDGYVNNRRSALPLGETKGEKFQSAGAFSKVGACTRSGYTGQVFEPADEYKGDLARTYFYMATRYEEKLADWKKKYSSQGVGAVLDGSAYPAFTSWQLAMLLEWAANDPVSQKELDRNNAVDSIQKNRNPFIDYPGLEQYVWGGMRDVAFSYDNYIVPDGSGGYQGGDETKKDPTFAGLADLSVGFGSSLVLTKGTATTMNIQTNGDASLSSSNPAVATTSGLTIRPVAVGTTFITVQTTETSAYNPGHTMFPVTVLAPEGKTSAMTTGSSFVKVSTPDELTDGEYLIVYEGGSVAFNGALSSLDAAKNFIAVSITDGTIAATEATDAATFTIDLSQMSIRSKSGRYIGLAANDNKLQTSDSPMPHRSISIDAEGGAEIVAEGGAHLRHNSQDDQRRFRYYKSSSYTNQKAVQLYRRMSGSATHSVTLGSEGFGTFCSEFAADLGSAVDFKAWIVTDIIRGRIVCQPAPQSVRGGTGLILKGAPYATVTIPSAPSDTLPESNLLVGTTAPTFVEGDEYYGLQGSAFVPVEGGTVSGGQALLPACLFEDSEENFIDLVDPATHDPDAIRAPKADGATTQTPGSERPPLICNPAGQRISGRHKGIRIQNGKKILF